jgi:RNA polymerase sigma-70 factor (ECF subfamily)
MKMSLYQESLVRHFKTSFDELRRFLTAKLRCAEEAAEVAQEAYIRLLDVSDSVIIHHPRALLFKIASNLAVDRMRQPHFRAARTAKAESLDTVPAPTPNPEAIVEALRNCRPVVVRSLCCINSPV